MLNHHIILSVFIMAILLSTGAVQARPNFDDPKMVSLKDEAENRDSLESVGYNADCNCYKGGLNDQFITPKGTARSLPPGQKKTGKETDSAQ